MGVLTAYRVSCSYLSILFGVTPGAKTPGFGNLYSLNNGHWTIPYSSVFSVYLHRIFFSLPLIFAAKITFLIGLSLECLVQICHGSSTMRTNKNIYTRSVFCEQLLYQSSHLYLDPHNHLLSQPFIPESFQIQMGFSFPFLRANYLRSSLLNIRACGFLLSCT